MKWCGVVVFQVLIALILAVDLIEDDPNHQIYRSSSFYHHMIPDVAGLIDDQYLELLRFGDSPAATIDPISIVADYFETLTWTAEIIGCNGCFQSNRPTSRLPDDRYLTLYETKQNSSYPSDRVSMTFNRTGDSCTEIDTYRENVNGVVDLDRNNVWVFGVAGDTIRLSFSQADKVYEEGTKLLLYIPQRCHVHVLTATRYVSPDPTPSEISLFDS